MNLKEYLNEIKENQYPWHAWYWDGKIYIHAWKDPMVKGLKWEPK